MFTQSDLNKGLILYFSPKEIGVYPKEFLFTFIGKKYFKNFKNYFKTNKISFDFFSDKRQQK
jgi:hypothetical protein